jgi:hypothetical protein
MGVLAETLVGRRVLVVSPFSKSIEINFKNRFSFFANYEYPDFNLQTYNAPITYAGLPNEFYPHEDWFETLYHMKEDIQKLDFDVAFLSCGSYALPLGNFIKEDLHRHAIYVGGILQLLFGVMGRRYENEFFLRQINREKFILPVEGAEFLKHVSITPETAREAFGAYF